MVPVLLIELCLQIDWTSRNRQVHSYVGYFPGVGLFYFYGKLGSFKLLSVCCLIIECITDILVTSPPASISRALELRGIYPGAVAFTLPLLQSFILLLY